MCGIVGFVNLNAYRSLGRKSWFEQALLVDQLRGPHSTGVFVVPGFDGIKQKFSDSILHKEAVDATAFLSLKKTEDALRWIDDAAVVIGHNRWATMGEVNAKNAHPFATSKVGLVHNGTLDNRNGLSRPHEVDSAAIALEMHHTEAKDYTKVLEKLEGAFCLVWTDNESERIYITRNSERPLFISYSPDGKVLYFASEDWMINNILDRKTRYHGNTDPVEIETGILYSTSYNPMVTRTLQLEEEKYTPQPTWTQSWNNAFDYHSNGPAKTYDLTAQGYPVDYVTQKKTPVTKGQVIYIDTWDWLEYTTKKGIGSILGVDSDHAGVSVVIPNVTLAQWKGLETKFNTNYAVATAQETVWLEGTVSAIDSIKNRTGWVTTVPFKTLKFSTFETEKPFETGEEDTKLLEHKEGGGKIGDTGKKSESNKSLIVGELFRVGSKYVSEDEWLEATSDGCNSCGCDLYIKTENEIVWEDMIINGEMSVPIPYCLDCADDLFTSEQINAVNEFAGNDYSLN